MMFKRLYFAEAFLMSYVLAKPVSGQLSGRYL